MNINPLLLTDFYKVHHFRQYPDNMTKLYSNFTPRKSRIKEIDKVVVFGIQHFVLEYLIKQFNKDFFHTPTRKTAKLNPGEVFDSIAKEKKDKVISEYKRHCPVDTKHIEALWDLGYLPIELKCLDEGTLCPIGVPMLTITNTHPDFAWLVNYLETLLSAMLWQPITSATIAHEYKKLLTKYALETDEKNIEFINWQGHDFSMRGMSSIESSILSGMGHLLSFTGTDTIPAIYQLESSYNAAGLIGASVPATEHSVMCMGTKESEIKTFERLLDLYPEGILSVVSDTWDLWKVCTEYLPQLKDKILARNGKLVIRPDSGDPVDIICGKLPDYIDFDNLDENSDYESFSNFIYEEYSNNITGKLVKIDGNIYKLGDYEYFVQDYGWDNGLSEIVNNVKQLEKNGLLKKAELPNINVNEQKGVIELLWDIFGGTVNEQGYKVLDPHIGAIYGDSITLERAKEICERLKAKRFASTNIVFGIGSYTYQYNTRDIFGFAMKATYGEIRTPNPEYPYSSNPNEAFIVECREIWKDPITDDGTKKSKKGLLQVCSGQIMKDGVLIDAVGCLDQQTWEEEKKGWLTTVFKDGKLVKETNLEEIRNKLKNQIK